MHHECQHNTAQHTCIIMRKSNGYGSESIAYRSLIMIDKLQWQTNGNEIREQFECKDFFLKKNAKTIRQFSIHHYFNFWKYFVFLFSLTCKIQMELASLMTVELIAVSDLGRNWMDPVFHSNEMPFFFLHLLHHSKDQLKSMNEWKNIDRYLLHIYI